MSFARNFAAGQQIAQNAMDTFRDVRQRRDLRRIADARPQELSGFSESDAEQMRAMSQAINPETGQPYYQFEDNGQGGLNVRNNFSFQGQDGQMVEPGSTLGMRQRPLTEFLGRRYDTPLTEQQIDAARYRAKADVIGRDDPIAGMRMRRELRQDERDDWRFGVEQQRAPLQTQQLEQQVRAGGLQLKGLEREDAWETGFGEALASYTGSEEQLREVIPFVNRSQAITMEDPDPKTGLVRLSVVKRDGHAVALNLNRQDQAQVFAAVQMMQSNPTRALEVLRRVNGDLADAVARENQLTGTLAGNANSVASAAHGMRMDEGRLDIARQGLRLQERQADAANNRAQAEDWSIIGVSNDGRGWVRFNRRTNEVNTSPMPEGMSASDIFSRISGQRPDISVEKIYEQLVGTQIPGQPKGARYTPEQALAEARRLAGGQQDPFLQRLDALLGAGTDPFATPAPEPNPAPAPRPQTAFDRRREETLAAEAARRREQQALESQRREEERRRLLEQRPDLQQLGGMRHFQ